MPMGRGLAPCPLNLKTKISYLLKHITTKMNSNASLFKRKQTCPRSTFGTSGSSLADTEAERSAAVDWM